jgi:hypothetical protein
VSNKKVRDLCAVGGSGEVLGDNQVIGVEKRRRGLDLTHGSRRRSVQQPRRGVEAAGGEDDSSPNTSMLAMVVVVLAGTPGSGSGYQMPGVRTSTTVATLRNLILRNRSPVSVPAAKKSSPPGSNTTCSSAVPATSCS